MLYWHKDGLLHRDNGLPSRSDISLPYAEMSNGEKHYKLEDGGKKIISHLKEEWFNKDNERHREDSHAISLYYTDGNIMRESYYLNGKRHREDGPALIQYNENGNIKCKIYYLNGNYHRDNGPAVIFYYENGNIKYEEYYSNGKRHRLNGPAYIKYEMYEDNTKYNGKKHISNYYYIDDILFSKLDFWKSSLTRACLSVYHPINKYI
jgi:antitoxin component YwqK of YwqJK toxin-antitoxin module